MGYKQPTLVSNILNLDDNKMTTCTNVKKINRTQKFIRKSERRKEDTDGFH